MKTRFPYWACTALGTIAVATVRHAFYNNASAHWVALWAIILVLSVVAFCGLLYEDLGGRSRFYTHRGQLFFVLKGDKEGLHDAFGVGPTLNIGYAHNNIYGVDIRILHLFIVKFTYIKHS